LLRIHGPKSGEVTAEWKKITQWQHCYFYAPPINVIKSRRMR